MGEEERWNVMEKDGWEDVLWYRQDDGRNEIDMTRSTIVWTRVLLCHGGLLRRVPLMCVGLCIVCI